MTEAVSCKECDFVNITVKIQNTTAGNFFEVGMAPNGVNTTIPQTQQNITTTIYNLHSSYNMSGFSASIKPISITFTKSLNNLRVS
jgi:putative alpha-1,2-mannosidase